MTKAAITVAILALLLPGSIRAQDHAHTDKAPYTGLQTRSIKSLSDEDIAEIRRGGGWGLALPAELNGRPGPAHLLELRDEIALSPEQVTQIQEIFDQMQSDAQAAGERFIKAEAALSAAFETADIAPDHLRTLIDEAAAARAELRFIHLSRHLSTPMLLTTGQIRKYNVLRGYTDDPCTTVPDGHDPDIWRRHNGCN